MPANNNQKLIRNMMYSTGYQVLAMFLPFATAYWTSRKLGVEMLGTSASANSIITYFVLVGSLGLQLYGSREIAYLQHDIKARSQLFFELVAIKLILFLLTSLAFIVFMLLFKFFAFAQFYKGDLQFYLWLASLGLLATLLDISWYFNGMEDFKIVVMRNTVVNVVITILVFVLIQRPSDLWKYMILLSLTGILGHLSVFPFLKKELVWVPFREWRLLRHVKPLVSLLLPQITIQIYLTLNRTMLYFLDGEKSVAYFGNADTVVRMGYTLASSFSGAFLPRLSNLLANDEHNEVQSLVGKAFDLSNCLSILMVAGLMGISSTFPLFYFGPGWQPVGPLMFAESIIVLLIGWSTIIGMQYLMATRRIKEFTYSALAALVVNLVLNFLLIPKMGAMGAVIATIVSEITITGYQLFLVRDILSIRRIFKGFWKYMLGGLAVFAVMVGLNLHMKPNTNVFVGVFDYLLQAMLATALYLGIIGVLRAPVLDTVRPAVKRLVQKIRSNRKVKIS